MTELHGDKCLDALGMTHGTVRAVYRDVLRPFQLQTVFES